MLCWEKPGEHELIETSGGHFFFFSPDSPQKDVAGLAPGARGGEAQNLPLEYQDGEASGRCPGPAMAAHLDLPSKHSSLAQAV